MKILQHCFGPDESGGPIVSFHREICNSSRDFGEIRQLFPAGGISIKLIKRFVREIKEFNPEIIHIRGLGNEGFHAVLAAKIAGVPNILLTIHGTHRDLKKSSSKLRQLIVVGVLETLSLKMATHIAAVCEFAVQRDFLVPFRKKIVGFVPNGVDVVTSSKLNSSVRREDYGIGVECTVGICVSRITHEKGYAVLADALNHLDSCVENFVVLVVGGGDEDGCIKRLFACLHNIEVIFLGHQKSVSDFLLLSDFFVFPSLHENLSNALIEAMAHQLPAIASAVGGNTEVLHKGGGVLVPVGDSQALAESIKGFLADPELVKRMGFEAKENVRQNYSIERMVAGWDEIYKGILKREHGKI